MFFIFIYTVGSLENDWQLVFFGKESRVLQLNDWLGCAGDYANTRLDGGLARLSLVAHAVHDVRHWTYKPDAVLHTSFGKISTFTLQIIKN